MCNNTLPNFKLEGNLEFINCCTCRERSERGRSMMAHSMPSMSMMKNPSKCFSRIVSKIENTRYVLHQNISLLMPILNCKELHINVVRASGWLALVDHCDCSFVIFIEYCQLLLQSQGPLRQIEDISSS